MPPAYDKRGTHSLRSIFRLRDAAPRIQPSTWHGVEGLSFAMRFKETSLKGVWIIEPTPVIDDRGSLTRMFCEKEMAACGLATRFVQHSRVQSPKKGTLRGMHYQEEPYGEVKLISCVRGAVFDVVVDLRPNSPTRNRWLGFELTPENMRQVYVPPGFGHGVQSLTDDTEVHYLMSQFYTPNAATGVRYDDPLFRINWPLLPTVISQRDKSWPLLRKLVS